MRRRPIALVQAGSEESPAVWLVTELRGICVIRFNTMKRRAGKTVTFSISVDAETRSILEQEASRSYGGNVSALVSAIAKEAKRQAALDWLLQGAQISETERSAFLAELDGKRTPRRRRRRAA